MPIEPNFDHPLSVVEDSPDVLEDEVLITDTGHAVLTADVNNELRLQPLEHDVARAR